MRAPGLAFGIAYLVVTVIHFSLFTRATEMGTARAIFTLAPFNLLGALIVLAGGAIGGTTQYVLWGITGLGLWLTPLLRGNSGFLIEPAHFVERHGLVMIIAMGESIVAIGFGASTLAVNGSLAAVVIVGLALTACLWWLYFGGDDERAGAGAPRAAPAGASAGWIASVRLLASADAARDRRHRRRRARGNGASVFVTDVGTGGDPRCAASTAYLAGDVLFRAELRIGATRWRAVGALLALAAIPVGARSSPFAESCLLVALLLAVIVVERFYSPIEEGAP